jgi:non-specific serine/threonine protein kinase
VVARLKSLRERSWHLAVLDEAQAIKNPGTRQARAVKELRTSARFALTGTPVENRAGDLWSIFDFLNPGLLGSASAFAKFVRAREEAERPDYGPLRALTRPYLLRRLKTDKRIIADLPDKTEVRAWCTLTKTQAALYQQAVTELAATLDTVDGIQRRGVVLACIMRFKQICNHPSQWLGDGGYAPRPAASSLACASWRRRLRHARRTPWSSPSSAKSPIRWRRSSAGCSGVPGSCCMGAPRSGSAAGWSSRSSVTTVRPFSC